MCGRYTNKSKWRDLVKIMRLPVSHPAEDPAPSYNIAPTQQGWVIADDGAGGLKAGQMKWGLVPFFSKDGKMSYATINARVEGVQTARSYREPFKSRRCLVVATGYYEWKPLDPTTDKSKQPFYIHGSEPVMLFAGLWDRWRSGEGEDLLTYSIVTMPAAGKVADLHTRMPAILPPDIAPDWVHGTVDDAGAILASLGEPELDFYPIGKAVGNVRNQGPQLIEPIA